MIRFLLILLLIVPTVSFAQQKENLMYSNGRIYVVVVVMLIILIGLILYLTRLDRKIKKLEQEN